MIAAGRAASRRRRAAWRGPGRRSHCSQLIPGRGPRALTPRRCRRRAERARSERPAGRGQRCGSLVAAPPPRLRLRSARTGARTCRPESPARGGAGCRPRPPEPGRRPRDTKERWARGLRWSTGAASCQSACSKFAQLGRLKPEPGAGEGRPDPRPGPEESPARRQPPADPRSVAQAGLHRKCVNPFVIWQQELWLFLKIIVVKN